MLTVFVIFTLSSLWDPKRPQKAVGRLICLLIRINSIFELYFSHFLAVTYLCSLAFVLTRSMSGPVRFVYYQNRNAKLILKPTDQPKTDYQKHTRKNGWCDTWRLFTPACKLKFQNLRQTTTHRYKLIPYIDTLIIRHLRINNTAPTMTNIRANIPQILNTHTAYFLEKFHDHVYVTIWFICNTRLLSWITPPKKA